MIVLNSIFFPFHTHMCISLRSQLGFLCHVEFKLPPILIEFKAKKFANFCFMNINFSKGRDVLTNVSQTSLQVAVAQSITSRPC